jgi:hypothetical protein
MLLEYRAHHAIQTAVLKQKLEEACQEAETEFSKQSKKAEVNMDADIRIYLDEQSKENANRITPRMEMASILNKIEFRPILQAYFVGLAQGVASRLGVQEDREKNNQLWKSNSERYYSELEGMVCGVLEPQITLDLTEVCVEIAKYKHTQESNP